MDSEEHSEEHDEPKPTALGRLREHFVQELDPSWTDVVLLFSCFIAGVLDSAVLNTYTCFVSMQTGNTVYVGLGFAGLPESSPKRWTKSLNAIICFSIGCLFFSRVTSWLGPLKRSTVVTSWLFQAALIFIAAGLILSNLIPSNAGDDKAFNAIILLPLGLLSFSSAGQIVQSRVFKLNEVPTVVLTSTYCDLMLDPQLFSAPISEDAKRNRRVLSILLLLLGAVCGGFLTRGTGVVEALWLAAGCKLLCAIVWVFWRGQGQASVHLH